MIQISDLRHRVSLCSQRDEVNGGEYYLARGVVAKVWAKIEAKAASAFSPHGMAMNTSRGQRTHIIWMRYRYDLEITAMAWVHEERRRSPPRWFKVLKVGQTEKAGNQFYKLECRLVERSDDAADPEDFSGPAQALPPGVQL